MSEGHEEIRLGLDIGSTTLKCVIANPAGEILFRRYRRHEARIPAVLAETLAEAAAALGIASARVTVSGSAGIGISERLGLPFVQEVYATYKSLKLRVPDADMAIELGGEDAKIIFLKDENGRETLEARMNGACAGGTGAFIDQMAALLGVDISEISELARASGRTYGIASRCGVFAKSDIQPLINQGADITDIAASILEAVVSQTIAGLAQGRRIGGRVVYLGGPLTFIPELRAAFDKKTGGGVCPEDSMYFVALGAALTGGALTDISKLIVKIKESGESGAYQACRPLFASKSEYAEFAARHARTGALKKAPAANSGNVYIGVDAGSTTVKAVAIDENGNVLMSDYANGGASPLLRVKDFFARFYREFPGANLTGCAATGYGEALIRDAFNMDAGVVETMAHCAAARMFCPDVDFIIDIGGQDIKCMKIRGGAIDNIYLNEACSSGCGSFLQAFAGAWGLSVNEFAQKGLMAERPVDLGSRCTVFMNSSVKQAQKDGATIENISAGLSMSVVKNALYKVIRAPNPDAIGRRIVVQGGTFLNDAILRAFETETGREAVRPEICELMGAYGAALTAKVMGLKHSKALTASGIESLSWKSRAAQCGGCENKCPLTIHDFGAGRRHISGSRCSRPLNGKRQEEPLNLYRDKREMLEKYAPVAGARGRIGIPLGLNMYELLPFWHTLWTKLGFEVIVSQPSSRETYQRGQYSIPSDTVCYPAKLMHGHAAELINRGVDALFYPCMTYNFDENRGDNHFNCPVVAYYPEVIRGNVAGGRTEFICDYVGPHNRRAFPGKFAKIVRGHFPSVTSGEVRAAADAAYAEYADHMRRVVRRGREIINRAREAGVPVVVLAGRPYHIDEEICHGIDHLICELGAAVVSEDAVCGETGRVNVDVLNQWTYHARLYGAARYVAELNDPMVNLVQLVSFGCGADAVTTDETRAILEESGRIYTQIKIDEIANLGAARIRLRSLFAAALWEEKA